MAAAGALTWLAAAGLFVLGISIATAGSRSRGWSLFALGALLAYSFGASVVLPRLFEGVDDPDVKGAIEALGSLLVVFGAGVGGALAQLWTEATLGLACGFSALAAVLLLVGGTAFARTLTSEVLLLALFAGATALGGCYASKNKPAATMVATALMGSLLAVCALDWAFLRAAAEGQLMVDLTALTTGDWEGIQGSGSGWAVFLGWLGLAFVGVLEQSRRARNAVWQFFTSFRRGDRQPYERMPGRDGPEQPKGKPAVRRGHKRGLSTRLRAQRNGPRTENMIPMDEEEEKGNGGDGGAQAQRQGKPKLCAEDRAVQRMLDDWSGLLAEVFGFQHESAFNQMEHLVILLGNQRRYREAAYRRLVPAGGVAAQLADEGLSPVDILHAKLFQNYNKWADHLKVKPQFNTLPPAPPKPAATEEGAGGSADGQQSKAAPQQQSPPPPPEWYETEAAQQKLHDCLLWLLIWGEAANMRHMPESLAWLYHKMAGYFNEFVKRDLRVPVKAEGAFLSETIAPIYEVVAAGSKGKDHAERRNYDDFNEFFWQRECLQCAWRPPEPPAADPESGLPTVTVVPSGAEPLHVAEAMRAGPKTFIEKRSWLAIALAFRRIIDFHVLTFQLLAVWAFWDLLCWDWPYGLQLLSSVFLTMNLLGILWCGLEVWQTIQDEDAGPVPAFRVKPEAKFGFFLRLVLRVAFLYQQCRFYGLSLQRDGMDLRPADSMADKAPQTEAWWQYVWLSLLLLSVWFVDCLFQLWPRLSTALFETRHPHLRALLDVVFPQSRNYTGKRVHERESRVVVYMGFWACVLAFKFYFSYYFEVKPLALPALELSDDLINIPGQSAAATAVLVLARWAPFVAIYALDSIIWYSLAAGLVGVLVGLDEKLGQVQDFGSIRAHFMRVPESFTSRLIFGRDDQRPPACRRRESTITELKMPRNYSYSSKQNLQGYGAAAAEETQPLVSRRPQQQQQQGYRSMSSSSGGGGGGGGGGGNGGGAFLDVATSKWKDFAEVWNSVVDNLRETDVISNDERAMLRFHFFDEIELNKPIYLPVFQTAGFVEKAERLCTERARAYRDAEQGPDHDPARRREEAALWQAFREDATMHEAIGETMELGLFLLQRVLGEPHAQDVQTIRASLDALLEQGVRAGGGADEEQGGGAGAGSILEFIKLEDIAKVRGPLGELVKDLKAGLKNRKANPNRKKSRMRAAPKAADSAPAYKQASEMKKSLSQTLLNSNTNLQGQTAAQVTPEEEEVEELDSLRDKVQRAMGSVLRGFKGLIDPEASKKQPQLSNIRAALSNILMDVPRKEGNEAPPHFLYDSHYASVALDGLLPDAKAVFAPVLAKLHGLLNLHVAEAEPRSAEARRRLAFFVNSLFMDLPKAPSVADMMSWTVLTPFYGEEVVYSRKELEAANKDGINQLLYLKTLYPTDWRNFEERLGVSDEQQLWQPRYAQELRMWASMRAQTLARTVQGMMYYEQALQLLQKLDRRSGGGGGGALLGAGADGDDPGLQLRRKFGYVVSCQIYGKQRQQQDPKAEDIEMLLRRYPTLRVAYIDEERSKSEGGETCWYSVLVKGSSSSSGGGGGGANKAVEEVYRVRLPGNPVLGEGKPENQNHAVIFTRGEHVMAIDMNQEGYYEDAFKMRNLLQEFAAADPDVPTTILGFREHIFTGGVSSLANYMALQEFSFVTLGQRVLNRPLRMRLHYGHPDLFDKLFFMQNGGVSKASKSINLSEDIFAGYNNVLRGGAVEFKEYVQVGKGRDVGMQQIYKFEAKLSEGAAEQSLSRDLNRMLARVDFFRLLSFYFGGIGHYLSSVLTVAAIWGLVYLMLGLALFGAEKIGDRPIVPEGALQFALAGVGVLQTVPLFCTLLLEKGFIGALGEIFSIFISGGPLYFIFHIRTRDYYYTQTVLAGGSGYKATGRGFVINHAPFDENFRFFAASHLYLGFEVAAALVLLALYSEAGQYAGRTWSLWFAAVAFLLAPFWFNPMTFEWDRVMEDYGQWAAWMGSTGGAVANSWESWWKDETSFVKKLGPTAKLYLVLRAGIWAVIAAGLLYVPLLKGADADVMATERAVGWNVLLDAGALLALFLLKLTVEACYPRLRSWRDRHMFIWLFYGVTAVVALDIAVKLFAQDASSFVFVLAGYYLLAFLTTCLLMLDNAFLTRHVVKRAHWAHDQLLAHVLFVALWVLAAVRVPGTWQRFVLYRNSLSKGVVVDNLIRNAQHAQAASSQATPAAESPAQQPPQPSQPLQLLGSEAVGGASAGAGGGLPRAGGASGNGQRISPEEKPADPRMVELEAGGAGSSLASGKKKNGRGAGAGGAQQQQQQQEKGAEVPPRPTQMLETFEFRQPDQFPKRS